MGVSRTKYPHIRRDSMLSTQDRWAVAADYNFCHVYQTLRVTPARQAGLTDHIWSLEGLVGPFELKANKAA